MSIVDEPDDQKDLIKLYANDLHLLVKEINKINKGPTYIFAQCGGSLAAMEYITNYNDPIEGIILHEPTLVKYMQKELLAGPNLSTIFHEQGIESAISKFKEMSGLDVTPPMLKTDTDYTAQMSRLTNNLNYFFSTMLPAMSEFNPDIEFLRNLQIPLIIGVGDNTEGIISHYTAKALAEDLKKKVVTFPGDHFGFVSNGQQFAKIIKEEFKSAAER